MRNDRIDQLEAEGRARSEQRDAQINDLNSAQAVTDAELSALKTENSSLKAAITKLEDERKSGVLRYWAQIVGGAALGVFVLNQAISPLSNRVDTLLDDNRLTQERQWQINTQSAYDRGMQSCMNERLRDVDKIGSRKWVDIPKGD